MGVLEMLVLTLLFGAVQLQTFAPHGLGAPQPRETDDTFVDPVHGIDEEGRGDREHPLRTIGFAVPRTIGVLRLGAGEYSEASGESFPIVIDSPWVYMSGEGVHATRVRGPSDPGVPAFVVPIVNEHSFSDFEVVTAGVAFRVHLTYETGLAWSRMEVQARRGIEVTVRSEPFISALLGLQDSSFHTTETTLVVDGRWSSSRPFEVILRRCVLSAGSEDAILDLVAGGDGRVRVEVTDCALFGAGAGLLLHPSDPLDLEVALRSSDFTGLGRGLEGGPLVVRGARSQVVSVRHSILWGNLGARDLPDYDPATYTLFENLVEEPRLVGVGGNVTGDPRFADASAGDLHLLPASAARGVAAEAGIPGYDLEGDPRGTGLDDDRVDLGIDEFFPRYHWFHPRPRLGRPTTLRILGRPGDLARVFAVPRPGDEDGLPALGTGLQLDLPPSARPFAMAVIGPDGWAEVELVLSPRLTDARLGKEILTQVVYTTPGGDTEFSSNVSVVHLAR